MTRTEADITTALLEPFDAALIEQKNGLSYLPHEVIRERLIDATDNCFDWSVDQVLFRDDGVTRRPVDRDTGELRRPPSMIVIGTLTIPGLGSRAGIGAHPLDEGSGEDSAYKSAESDAIKRAAMAFGVGLRQLYIDKVKPAAKRQATTRTAAQKAENVHPVENNTTSKPNYPLGMTDDEFAVEFKKATAKKDTERIKMLVDSAGQSVPRWLSMIGAVPNEASVEWIERQMQNKGVTDPDIVSALKIRRGEFAV
jgi:hypothetical protein